MILDLSQARSQILKGWHDMHQMCDTPSGFVKRRTRVYNHSTPSEFFSSLDRVFGYGLKHEDAFRNTHLGRIGR